MRMRASMIVLMALPLMAAQTRPATGPAAASQPATKPVDYYALSPDEFFKSKETKARIGKEQLDAELLEAAIFQESNRERAKADLPAFKHSDALQLMGRRHSAEMAKLQFFDHVSPTPANKTIVDRLKNVGMGNISVGENIAAMAVMEVVSGSYITRRNDDGSVTWTDAKTGQRLQNNTYEELAKAVVKSWMASPEHKANMLQKRFAYLGVGAARGPYGGQKQDSMYMTQDFSSGIRAVSEEKAADELKGK